MYQGMHQIGQNTRPLDWKRILRSDPVVSPDNNNTTQPPPPAPTYQLGANNNLSITQWRLKTVKVKGKAKITSIQWYSSIQYFAWWMTRTQNVIYIMQLSVYTSLNWLYMLPIRSTQLLSDIYLKKTTLRNLYTHLEGFYLLFLIDFDRS